MAQLNTSATQPIMLTDGVSDDGVSLTSLLFRPPHQSVKVKQSTMRPSMQMETVQVAVEAMEKSEDLVDVAKDIKDHFDKVYSNDNWQCIIGRKFGAYVTHEVENFIQVQIGNKTIMLYKPFEH